MAKKIRLYPNKKQLQKIDQIHSDLHEISNYITGCILFCDIKGKPLPLDYYWYKFVNQIFPLLREYKIPATAINAICNAQRPRLQKIISERKKKKPARVRFHRYIHDQPLSIEQTGKSIQMVGNKIQIHKELGPIKFLEKGTDIKDLINNNKISYSRYRKDKEGRVFLTVISERKEKPLPKTGKICSIDIGSKKNITLLEKNKKGQETVFVFNMPDFKEDVQKIENAMRRLSRSVERKKKEIGNKNLYKGKYLLSKDYSNNMKRQLKIIAKFMRRFKDKRSNWRNELTFMLVKNYDIIIMETLSIKGMTKSRKGSKEKKGKMVKQKSAFNRKFLNFSPYEFKRQIKYKTELYGKQLIEAPRNYPSTKKCSKCDHVNPSLNQSIRIFRCEKCSFEIDRDENACKNLIKRDFKSLKTKVI